MSKYESIRSVLSREAKTMVVCGSCQTSYSLTKHYKVEVYSRTLPDMPSAVSPGYFRGRCPNCHTLDSELFPFYSDADRAIIRAERLVNRRR